MDIKYRNLDVKIKFMRGNETNEKFRKWGTRQEEK